MQENTESGSAHIYFNVFDCSISSAVRKQEANQNEMLEC